MSAHRHLLVTVALIEALSTPAFALTTGEAELAVAGAGAAALGASAILGRRARSVGAAAMDRMVPRPSEPRIQALTSLDDPRLMPETAPDIDEMRRGLIETIPGRTEAVEQVWASRRLSLENVYEPTDGSGNGRYFVIDDKQIYYTDDFLTPDRARTLARVLRSYDPGTQIRLTLSSALEFSDVDALDIDGYDEYLKGMTFEVETTVYRGPAEQLAPLFEFEGDSRIVSVSVEVTHPDQIIQHPPMSEERIAAINQGAADRNLARETARAQIVAANDQIGLENERARAAYSEQMAAFERTLDANEPALTRAARLRNYSRLAGGTGAGLIGVVILRHAIGQAHGMDHSQDPRTQRLRELARESAAARAEFRAQTRAQANGRH